MLIRIFRIFLLIFLTVFMMLLVVLFSPALWRHWVTYPKLEKQRIAFAELRKAPESITELKTYRGLMHLHSYWSHDSEGTLNDLLPAAKNAGIDFIFLSDHPRSNIDTIPRGYKGYFDGILIEPGSEKQGFDTWPLDSVVIDWNINKDTVAKKIVESGGILFYAHPEEPHNWGNPYYQGMEIYNFHSDVKDETTLLPAMVNLLVNGRKYGNWAQRQLFDEQLAILQLWDSLNCKRKIVGFSAVDTHENQNLRARYLKDGRVEWVGPNANIIDTTDITIWNRWLFSEPDANGWIFKVMLDTYWSGFNHIVNYVLADTLTVTSLSDNIKAGHLFTAFKYLGDADGFIYYATGQDDKPACILGDSIGFNQVKSLDAVSPLPGQFRLFHNGNLVNVSESDDYKYAWGEMIEKGAYRIEVHIKIEDDYIPWLYTNPIYIF